MALQDQPEDLTIWLRRMSEGDPHAADVVASSVYRELHRLAGAILSHEYRHNSLQPTLLVNEALVRLIRGSAVDWHDRQHFLMVASR